MDLYVTTSRGKDLNFPNKEVIFGGHMSDLVKTTLNHKMIQNIPYNNSGPNFVYIIGGIPDATDMLRDPGYEEVIFYDATKKTNLLNSRISEANHAILEAGAIPVFSTITTMNIKDWNYARYFKNITSYHIHSPYYDDMQHFLNITLGSVNENIFTINNSNNVETPHLAGYIRSKRGDGQGFRYRYSRLYDGCHPGLEVVKKWQSALERIAVINRSRHSRSSLY